MISTWRDIPGFFDFKDVYDLAVEEAKHGARFVEVGGFLGKSAVYMLQSIFRAQKYIELFVVDSWDQDDWAQSEYGAPDPPPGPELSGLSHWQAFNKCIAGIDGLIRPLRETSLSASTHFKDASLDFVFIDADHSYESVKADIDAWLPKVRHGGILAGHDYGAPLWPGVKQAVDERFPNVEYMGSCWMVRL
jgi:hypothetical protein